MELSRRDVFQMGGKLLVLASVGATLEQITGAAPPSDAYRMADHWWGMIIDIDKCIGCGNCVRACSKENNVPDGYFRTWVERYQIEEGKQCQKRRQDQGRGRVDLARQIALIDQRSESQRHNLPHEKTVSRRENSNSKTTNMTTCTAHSPISNGSFPCATQA